MGLAYLKELLPNFALALIFHQQRFKAVPQALVVDSNSILTLYDFAPHTPRGRVIVAVWMVASMFLVSIFASAVASYFTVTMLTRAPTSTSVLAHSRVEVLSGTTSEQAFARLLIPWGSVENLEQGVETINNETLDALVYDKVLCSITLLATT